MAVGRGRVGVPTQGWAPLRIVGGVHAISIGENLSTPVDMYAVVREIDSDGDLYATVLRKLRTQGLHEPTMSYWFDCVALSGNAEMWGFLWNVDGSILGLGMPAAAVLRLRLVLEPYTLAKDGAIAQARCKRGSVDEAAFIVMKATKSSERKEPPTWAAIERSPEQG